MSTTLELQRLVDLTAKLHEAETDVERWERVLDKLYVGAWETYPNGEMRWISPQGLLVMAGPDATLEDFIHNKWVSRIHPDDREAVVQHWTNCLENRTEFLSVHRMVWEEGHVEALFFYGRCNSKGWVGTIIPVTPVVELANHMGECIDAARI